MSWNWTAIGAAINALAATGIVGSLYYLAKQVRLQIKSANSQMESNRENAARWLYDAVITLNMLSIQDKDVMTMAVSSALGTSLGAVDQVRFHLLWTSTFLLYQEAFDLRNKTGFWQTLETQLKVYLDIRGIAAWWDQNSFRYADDFVKHVDALRVRAAGSDANGTRG